MVKKNISRYCPFRNGVTVLCFSFPFSLKASKYRRRVTRLGGGGEIRKSLFGVGRGRGGEGGGGENSACRRVAIIREQFKPPAIFAFQSPVRKSFHRLTEKLHYGVTEYRRFSFQPGKKSSHFELERLL
jgi:hypothetical protein